MAKLLRMPEVAANVVEAVLQEWAVADNMPFAAQDAIATVETDKAVVEVAAPEAGVILKQLVPAGESVEVGAPIAILGEPGEQVADLAKLLAELGVAAGEENAVPTDAVDGTAVAEAGVAAAGAAAGGPDAGAVAGTAAAGAAVVGAGEPAAGEAEGGPGAGAAGAGASDAAARNGDAGQRSVAAPPGNVPGGGNVPAARQFASPLARRLAKEAGLAIEQIAGTGPGGRVVRRDIEMALARRDSSAAEPVGRSGVGVVEGAEPAAAGVGAAGTESGVAGVGVAGAESGVAGVGVAGAESGVAGVGVAGAESGVAGVGVAGAESGVAGVGVAGAAPAAPAAVGAEPRAYTDIPHSRIRRAIAARLSESVRTAPHFYLRATVRVDKLLKLRARLTNVTINDLLLKAAAHAHVAVPAMNVIWTPDAVRAFEHVDIAIAVATDQGLVTPVVRDVDRRSISDLAAATRDLANRARQHKLKQHEIDGGTLTLSNLGKYGTEEFAAIINPPHAAILAIGATRREPVVKKGKPAVATVIRCTLSVDHRPVDGVTAARWLDHFVDTVEHPLRILS